MSYVHAASVPCIRHRRRICDMAAMIHRLYSASVYTIRYGSSFIKTSFAVSIRSSIGRWRRRSCRYSPRGHVKRVKLPSCHLTSMRDGCRICDMDAMIHRLHSVRYGSSFVQPSSAVSTTTVTRRRTTRYQRQGPYGKGRRGEAALASARWPGDICLSA